MPIRTYKLNSKLTNEDRIKIWFMQLKLRLRKRKQDRDELLAKGRMRPERLP